MYNKLRRWRICEIFLSRLPSENFSKGEQCMVGLGANDSELLAIERTELLPDCRDLMQCR